MSRSEESTCSVAYQDEKERVDDQYYSAKLCDRTHLGLFKSVLASVTVEIVTLSFQPGGLVVNVRAAKCRSCAAQRCRAEIVQTSNLNVHQFACLETSVGNHLTCKCSQLRLPVNIPVRQERLAPYFNPPFSVSDREGGQPNHATRRFVACLQLARSAHVDNLVTAISTIISLALLESLLSIDNALVLASMVAHLPDKEKKRALSWGFAGAYVQRAIALAFFSHIARSSWLLMGGAIYLIYLMCARLTGKAGAQKGEKGSASGSFWATVLSLQLADFSFSVDNIVAAVAISPHLWVVLIGVFTGMAAMLVASRLFVKLIEKFPVLEPASYVVLGFIGGQLAAQQIFAFELAPAVKLSLIALTLGGAVLHARFQTLQRMLRPLTGAACVVMSVISLVIEAIFYPAKWFVTWLLSAVRRKR